MVELDEPSATVRVDGQDLVITGVGPREFRLATGPHRVTAAQGQSGLLDEVVTIVKHGKTVVRVRREPPAREAAVAGAAPGDPALPKSPHFIRELAEPEGPVSGVSFLPGGLTALTAVRGGAMWIWDLRSAWELYTFHAEGHQARTLTFVPPAPAPSPAGRMGRSYSGTSRATARSAGSRGTRGPSGRSRTRGAPAVRVDRRGRHRPVLGHRLGRGGPPVPGSSRGRPGAGPHDRRPSAADRRRGRHRPALGPGDGRDSAGFGAVKGAVRGLGVVPNARHLVFGGEDRLVYIADIETGWVTPGMAGHTGPIVALSVGGRLAARPVALRGWDDAGLGPRQVQGAGAGRGPRSCHGAPVATRSRLALTGGEDGITRLWLIPLATGEAGEPTPTEIISPESSPDAVRPKRPQEFLQPMLQDRRPTTN